MKTMNFFTEICLFFLLTLISGEVQSAGIQKGNRSTLFQDRYFRMRNIYPEVFQLHVNPLNQRSNEILQLKSALFPYRQLDYLINHYWDPTNGSWQQSCYQQYNYDEAGNMFQTLYRELEPYSGQMCNRVKESYAYFARGKVSRYISCNWSLVLNQWFEDIKREYIYNSQGHLTRSSYFTLDADTDGWIENYRMEYLSDSQGNNTMTQVYSRDETSGEWKKEWRDEYTYNNTGELIRFIAYKWEQSSGTWKASFMDEYLFDDYGNQNQVLYYQWSDVSKWVPVFRDDLSYDTRKNLVRLVSYLREESSGAWRPVYMEENSFSNSCGYNDLILPFCDRETRRYFCHQLMSITEYDMNLITGKWDLSNRIDFFYSDKVTATRQTKLPELIIYPNPATDEVTVFCPGFRDNFLFRLFDVNGREILSCESQSGKKIPLSGIKCGVYFYRLKAGERLENGKLVVK